MRISVKAGVPAKMDAGDERSFEAWFTSCDALLTRCRGISINDLPDCRFRDWYDDRLRPIHAVNRALELAGAFDEEDGEYDY